MHSHPPRAPNPHTLSSPKTHAFMRSITRNMQILHMIEVWLQALGVPGLFILSVIESIFFPVPPDALLIPLAITAPQTAWSLAAITTFGSVLGGILGHLLGGRLGRPVLERWVGAARIARVEALFQRYDAAAIVAAAFTPIPFKVFTVSAGLFCMPVGRFVLAATVGRGARFFAEAAVIAWAGRERTEWVIANLGWLSAAIGGFVVAVWLVTRVIKRRAG